jgi:hypothetical protein
MTSVSNKLSASVLEFLLNVVPLMPYQLNLRAFIFWPDGGKQVHSSLQARHPRHFVVWAGM